MKAITQFLLKVKLRSVMFGICIWQESFQGVTQLNERERDRETEGRQRDRDPPQGLYFSRVIIPLTTLLMIHPDGDQVNGSFRMFRATFLAPLLTVLTSSHISFRRNAGRTWEN